MRLRIVFLSLALAAASPAAAQEALPAAPRGDLGLRWWVSTGETQRAHNAQSVSAAAGNPTSVLLYENLDANVFELFGRYTLPSRWFFKGFVGYGKVNRGSFDDEDFLAGQLKFSDTTSSVTQGHVGYGALDVGYQWSFREGAARIGVFGGFTQWTEEVDAYGATDHLGFTGDASRDVRVITNEVRWRGLRLGVAGDFAVSRRLRLALDFAALPYAEVRNEDSHHLRADLGPVPNIVLEGDGWGVQLDAEVRYALAPRTELGLGWRYWHMEIRDGERKLPNLPGFPELPLTELYSTRTGLTLSLRRLW
jgi:hypothetical protein